MSYYLIGIGGTGARCMEAFLHLNGAGLLKDRQDVQLVYVDADVSCGNLLKTQVITDLYNKARELGFSSHELFKNSVQAGDVWSPVDENCDNLDDIFEKNKLSAKKSLKSLGYLYESLFTEEERTTNLDMGFRGHPAIGAAVMNSSMSNEVSPWKELLPKINTDKDAKIFLFASVFGGTGAAGFPTIAKLLKDSLKKDNDGKSLAKIGGALVLPYFQFPPAKGELRDEMQAKVDEFMLNTRSALDYYNKNNYLGDVFTSIYMVGDNDLTEVGNFALGAKEQKNAANIIEVYAALAAFDFFNKGKYEEGSTPMIARGDNNDSVTWDDIPNVCIEGNVKDKLSTYIKFLYVYKNGVLPYLEECAADENYCKQVSWYIDLVQKAGKIDVYKDRELMDSFRALGEYADNFFAWIGEIVKNPKRNIELINRDIYVKEDYEASFNLDAYQVVLPIVDRKDKLDKKALWNKLTNYVPNKTTANGAGILLEAVEEICSSK